MKGNRQANIELLRILAMFMILVIHANMISLPRPSQIDLTEAPSPVIMRYFIESLGIVGVNIFVLISGWFHINTRAKSFMALVFQVITLWGVIYLFLIVCGVAKLTVSGLLEVVFFTRWGWFIKAYIVLMILAPVLNTFVEHSSEKQQRYVLIGFFLFSSSYGWLGGGNRFFVNGYGPLHFIGLYLLSSYARNVSSGNIRTTTIIKSLFTLDKRIDILVYIICVIINTMLGIWGLYNNKDIYGLVFAYINPFTIIGALYLMLFFSKLKISSSKIISFLATGSFAVYLVHSQIDLRPFFTNGVLYLFEDNNGLLCIGVIFLYLILVYLLSILIDLPRLWFWKRISDKYNIK